MREAGMRFRWICAAALSVILFVGAPFAEGSADGDMSLVFTEPYLVSLRPATEMNVCWLISEPASEAHVEFGATASYGNRVEAVQHRISGLKRSPAPTSNYDPDPARNPDLPVYQLIARLSDLKPGELVYYRVVTRTATRSQTGKDYHFRTAPARDKAVKFALLSDLQLKQSSAATVKMVGQTQPDFIIYNGDFVNTAWKTGEWFPVPGVYVDPRESGKEWFAAMQQTADGCRLLQYAPIFPSPGNHELTEQRVLTDKALALEPNLWDFSVYMQLFRPLYPEQQFGRGGKHWYSADFGDMHVVSLSVVRWHPWDGFEAPGWQIFDDISPGSAQYRWLAEDLASAATRYKWVTMHWHMFNRGSDGHVPYSPPKVDAANPNRVQYPEPDWCHTHLRPLFSRSGVNGVSFGHSHVYERYLVDTVHYIEAASIGNTYRRADDPYHPSGHKPVVEESRFRSFMLQSFGPGQNLSARGIQASVEANQVGHVGRVFDEFDLTDKPKTR